MSLNKFTSATTYKGWMNYSMNLLKARSIETEIARSDELTLVKIATGIVPVDATTLEVYSKTGTTKIYVKDDLGNEKMLLDTDATSEEAKGIAIIYYNGLPQVATSTGAYLNIINPLTPGIGSLTFPANSLNNNDMYKLKIVGTCSFATATTMRFGITFNDIFFRETNLSNNPNIGDYNLIGEIYFSFYSKDDVPGNIICSVIGNIQVFNGPVVQYSMPNTGSGFIPYGINNDLLLKALTTTVNPGNAIRTLYTTFERIN